MSELLRKAAEQAALAIFPVMSYGLPGTKDTQQKELQLAYAELIKALASDNRIPLSQTEVIDAYCKLPHTTQFVSVFEAGVRFAEKYHKISK